MRRKIQSGYLESYDIRNELNLTAKVAGIKIIMTKQVSRCIIRKTDKNYNL